MDFCKASWHYVIIKEDRKTDNQAEMFGISEEVVVFFHNLPDCLLEVQFKVIIVCCGSVKHYGLIKDIETGMPYHFGYAVYPSIFQAKMTLNYTDGREILGKKIRATLEAI